MGICLRVQGQYLALKLRKTSHDTLLKLDDAAILRLFREPPRLVRWLEGFHRAVTRRRQRAKGFQKVLYKVLAGTITAGGPSCHATRRLAGGPRGLTPRRRPLQPPAAGLP